MSTRAPDASPPEGATGALVPPQPVPPPAPTAGPGHTETPPARGLTANVTALAASQAVTWSMTLAWTVIVPRFLGPADMGVLVTAMSAAGIFGIVLGLPTRDFLAREVVADIPNAPRLIGAALLFKASLVPVFVGAIAGYATVASLGGDAVWVLYLCTAAVVCSLLTEPAQAVFQALERMQYLAYAEVLNKTLQSLGGIALVVVGAGVVALSAYNLAVAAVVLLLTQLWLRRHLAVDLRPDLRRTARMVRASAPYWTFGVFFMIYLWIDAVMLGLMTPPEVVGWYGVAMRLFQTLMFLPVLLCTAWLPRLVRAYGSGERALHLAARAPLELVVVLSVPVCVGAAMSAPLVIPLLYGDEYHGAIPVLAILGLSVPAMYLNIVLNQVLIASSRPLVWAKVMALATVVNPLLNLVLIPVFQRRWGNGGTGAALALLLTELVVVGIGMLLVGRHVVAPSSLLRIGKALLAGLVMAAGMHLASPAGPLVAVAAGALAFPVASVVLGLLTTEERSALWAEACRLRHRGSRGGSRS